MHLGKRALAIILILSATWLLTRTPRRSEIIPPQATIVTYWEKWTGDEALQMQQIVDTFNRTVGAEKRIFVRYLSMSQIEHKTLVATAAGVPPDVAGLWEPYLMEFADLDALEPLDRLAAEYGITPQTYKPVFWETCHFNNGLWALPSTPAATALIYNKRVFWENADRLRRAGLDPHRAPRTIAQLDRYAELLTTRMPNDPERIDRAGYVPIETWYVDVQSYWFGGKVFDEGSERFCITDAASVRAFDWFRDYFRRYGTECIGEFRSGLGGFNSTQNPFLSGKLVMQQQGPWMANFAYNLRPEISEVLLPKALEPLLPRAVRSFNYAWGVAPFPSDVASLDDVTYCGLDVLAIPRKAKHKREAFEFIAYVQRQEVMEKLCALHCKGSPLAKVSDTFYRDHPNPYIELFDRLGESPNAHPIVKCPIAPEIIDEMTVMSQRLALLECSAAEACAQSQKRLEEKYAQYMERKRVREKAVQ